MRGELPGLRAPLVRDARPEQSEPLEPVAPQVRDARLAPDDLPEPALRPEQDVLRELVLPRVLGALQGLASQPGCWVASPPDEPPGSQV